MKHYTIYLGNDPTDHSKSKFYGTYVEIPEDPGNSCSLADIIHKCEVLSKQATGWVVAICFEVANGAATTEVVFSRVKELKKKLVINPKKKKINSKKLSGHSNGMTAVEMLQSNFLANATTINPVYWQTSEATLGTTPDGVQPPLEF